MRINEQETRLTLHEHDDDDDDDEKYWPDDGLVRPKLVVNIWNNEM